MGSRNRKKRGDKIQRMALDEPRSVTLDDIAEIAKRKRVTIEKYRELELRMPDDVRSRLATFLDEHAQRLRDIAAELRDRSRG